MKGRGFTTKQLAAIYRRYKEGKDFSDLIDTTSSTSDEHVPCFLGDRKVVVVPIPKEVAWRFGTKAMAFYLSTNTSNAVGFKDVYFPFAGILPSKGEKWFVKMSSQQFGPHFHPDWFKAVCSSLKIRDCERYEAFFTDKFLFWWQVRISAALGGDIWSGDDMVRIRDFAMKNGWDEKSHRWTDDRILPLAVRKETCDEGADLNAWLDAHDALLIKSWEEYDRMYGAVADMWKIEYIF